MGLWRKNTVKSLLLPGGAIFGCALISLQSGLVPPALSFITIVYWGVFVAAFLLAWRFHSSRALFAVIVLLLARYALEFFGANRAAAAGAGQIALQAIAVLLPLNFAVLALARERGLILASIKSWLALIFGQSVVVAILCRPGATAAPRFLSFEVLPASWLQWSRLPQLAWIAFLIASIILLHRLISYGKPIEGGLLWSLAAAFLGLQAGGAGGTAAAYFAVGGSILACSLVENSYVLAYHDELTALPARRAFNDFLLRLPNRYTVAVVDIDHFKKFNDTYGHETGDQVLQMVAAKLARVSGGGQAFRVGGEEFAILFPGESLSEARPHLEILRMEIESSSFRVRGRERRAVSHGTDRRRALRSKHPLLRRKDSSGAASELSVTVSIGVAESTARTRHAEQVIQAADQALYRAKRAGRNRVEMATRSPSRSKRNIA